MFSSPYEFTSESLNAFCEGGRLVMTLSEGFVPKKRFHILLQMSFIKKRCMELTTATRSLENKCSYSYV